MGKAKANPNTWATFLGKEKFKKKSKTNIFPN